VFDFRRCATPRSSKDLRFKSPVEVLVAGVIPRSPI